MKTWAFMWRLIRYRPALYSITAACWILVSVSPVVPGLLIQQYFNTVAKTPYLTRAVWELIILLLITAGVRAVFIILSAMLGNLSRFSMTGLIRHNLLKYILESNEVRRRFQRRLGRPSASSVTMCSKQRTRLIGPLMSWDKGCLRLLPW